MTILQHPQPEYIITEEQLREIIFFAYADLKDEENIHETIKDSLKAIRSRSYTPARNDSKEPQCLCETCCMTVEQCRGSQLEQASRNDSDVLDKLRDKYVEFMNHPCPELAEKYNHGCDAEYCGLCILDEVLEQLRQQQEQ